MAHFRAMQSGWQPPPQGYGYGSYEFNPLENGVIGKCAGRAKLFGWISCVAGIFQCIGGGCGAIGNPIYAMYVPYGIVGVIVGITFIGVGNSLQNIVASRGADVPHLMQGLEKLGGGFLIQAITSVVMLIVGSILGVIMSIVYLASQGK